MEYIILMYCRQIRYKKAFQSKVNRPLADRCMGYIVNKFEQVRGQVPKGGGVGGRPYVNKFEHVHGEASPCRLGGGGGRTGRVPQVNKFRGGFSCAPQQNDRQSRLEHQLPARRCGRYQSVIRSRCVYFNMTKYLQVRVRSERHV